MLTAFLIGAAAAFLTVGAAFIASEIRARIPASN